MYFVDVPRYLILTDMVYRLFCAVLGMYQMASVDVLMYMQIPIVSADART